MNTICQDRGITANALALPCMGMLAPAQALMGCALEIVRSSPYEFSITGRSTLAQVGKTFANWTSIFANWIQLAKLCQLHSLKNQRLSNFSFQLAVGSWKLLPTDRKPAWMLGFDEKFSWRKLPLPTGEVNTPDLESGCVPLSRARHIDGGHVGQVEVWL